MTHELSKERLEKIASWREKYGAGHNVMLTAEEAEVMARAFLAAHEQEPVAWTDEVELRDMEKNGCAYLFKIDAENPYHDPRRLIKLFTHPAPSIPAAVPEEPPEEVLPKGGSKDACTRRGGVISGWKVCRAAMLQSEPVKQQVTLREGIQAIRDLGGIDAEKILAEREALNEQDCWCHTCRPVTMGDMQFVVCPDCGNKRCPKANDHRNACSGSNEPWQEGSAYPAAPKGV